MQVQLDPGESKDVRLEFPASRCTLVTAGGRRVVEPGAFELRVGPSSRGATQLVAGFEILESQGSHTP